MICLFPTIVIGQETENPMFSDKKIKTKKSDGEKNNDLSEFHNFIVIGLNATGSDVDAIYQFLDSAGSQVNYREYGEALFDILIAGGLLMPGGSVAQDGDNLCKTKACIFEASDDMASMRSFEQVFVKLMHRYNYLEKMFVEEIKKVLMSIKGFTESERIKLARMTALWIANGSILPQVLTVILNEHLVKDSLALDFLLEVFVTWKQEKGLASMMASLKKSRLERSLMEFVPPNKRTEEYFKTVFDEKGLQDVVKLHLAQERQGAERCLEQHLSMKLAEQAPIKNIISDTQKIAAEANIPEHEVVILVWSGLMAHAKWNTKEELLIDKALNLLKQYTSLLAAFTQTLRSEISLMREVQKYCYENTNFMKVLQKIVLLLYKTDIISEQVFLFFMRWYQFKTAEEDDPAIVTNENYFRLLTGREPGMEALEGMMHLHRILQQPVSLETPDELKAILLKYPQVGLAFVNARKRGWLH